MCATAVSDFQDLQQWIQNVLGMILLTRGVFQQGRQSMFRLQLPVLKTGVDTASILCNILEAITRKPCFRISVFIAYIFLVFGLDSFFVDLASNFFFHPVNNDVLGAESLLRS